MKKSVVLGFVIVFILCVFWWRWGVVVMRTADWQGRRVIYPESSEVSKYGGVGRVTKQAGEMIFAVPKGVGRPVLISSEYKNVYHRSEYEVTTIPAQEQLLYVVGMVVGWEDVTDSSDKYLVIAHPETGVEEKYRIELGQEGTRLGVEKVGKGSEANVVEKPNTTQLVQLGYEAARQVMRRGDVVILFPVFAPPEWAAKDENGGVRVSSVMVRRRGGAEQLNNEIKRAEGGR